MARATYAELGDACATAHAMELIGARWTYPILRELVLGPKRFTVLLASIRGITPAVLTSRLRELTDQGLVEVVDGDGAVSRYALTDWAQGLAPIMRHLGRWAQGSPSRTGDGGLTPDASVQAMITLGETVPAPEMLVFTLELVDQRVDAEWAHRYRVQWTAHGMAAEPGAVDVAAPVVRCDSSAWAGLLWNHVGVAASGVRITGDAAAERGVRSFVRALRAAAG